MNKDYVRDVLKYMGLFIINIPKLRIFLIHRFFGDYQFHKKHKIFSTLNKLWILYNTYDMNTIKHLSEAIKKRWSN